MYQPTHASAARTQTGMDSSAWLALMGKFGTINPSTASVQRDSTGMVTLASLALLARYGILKQTPALVLKAQTGMDFLVWLAPQVELGTALLIVAHVQGDWIGVESLASHVTPAPTGTDLAASPAITGKFGIAFSAYASAVTISNGMEQLAFLPAAKEWWI